MSLNLLALAYLVISTVQGGRLHPQWCSFIADLCRKIDENQSGSSFSSNLMYVHQEFSTNYPYLHLLPPILIWAPVEQFREVLPNCFHCPKCECPTSILHGCGWMNGVESERTEPRRIHGRDGIVLLVGRRYKCSKEAHEVVSYHPGILRQLQTPSLIPFRLWSRTGFTSALTNDIMTMVVSGLSASTIESNLVSATVVQFSVKRRRFIELQGRSSRVLQSGQDFPSYEQWNSFLPAVAPSRHAISACFLSSFWENHSLFERHMQCTTITDTDSWLSCDHTFTSAGKYVHCACCNGICTQWLIPDLKRGVTIQ